MKPVPETPMESLAIFCRPDAEDWERDYAAMMITSLDAALPHLAATARNPNASAALQPRVAECLANAWRTEECILRQISKVLRRSPERKFSSSEVKDRHKGFDANIRHDRIRTFRLIIAENPEWAESRH